VIELYAVTDRPGEPLPDLAPLDALVSGDLAVVYGPAADTELSGEALWRHEEVVEALMEGRDVLPFRYGTRCADAAAATRAVAARQEELAAALERIRGAVELSVRVLLIDVGEARPKAAADYVAGKTREAARARAVLQSIHEPLSGRARVSRQTPSGAPGEPLRAAYLVDREEVDAFAAQVAALQARHPDLRLLCTGPWPPYSFVEP
jgi:Gas vesicle synthesis protein GvpL/GvpF